MNIDETAIIVIFGGFMALVILHSLGGRMFTFG
jgi:hypothetical protein